MSPSAPARNASEEALPRAPLYKTMELDGSKRSNLC